MAETTNTIRRQKAPNSSALSGEDQKEQSSRIPSLDGLRAISILLVIVGHLVYSKGFVLPPGVNPEWSEGIGGLGVRVFFVISGYLITSLLLQELDRRETIHLAKFYLRRTLRIFAPYYFFVLVVILLNSVAQLGITSQDILHAFTYTVNYYPERSWDIGHAWSLSVEEQFYLIWPAILLIAGKRRGLWLAFSFVILAPLIRLGYSFFIPSLIRYETGYRFETAADAIAIGCLLAGTQQWLLGNRFYQRVMDSRLMVLVPLIVFGASKINPESKPYLLIGVTVQNVGVVACVAWCMKNYSGRVGRMLNWRPIVFLGGMSYSIYLWQQVFTNYLRPSAISTFPLNILLIAAVSFISFCLIERPSLALRAWLEKRIFGVKAGEADRAGRATVS